MAPKNKFYGVRKGKKTGVYRTWEECQLQIKGIKDAEYRSFLTENEANEYVKDEVCNSSDDCMGFREEDNVCQG